MKTVSSPANKLITRVTRRQQLAPLALREGKRKKVFNHVTDTQLAFTPLCEDLWVPHPEPQLPNHRILSPSPNAQISTARLSNTHYLFPRNRNLSWRDTCTGLFTATFDLKPPKSVFRVLPCVLERMRVRYGLMI
jgi:hypothetical protein